MQKAPIESYFQQHFSDERLKREVQRAGVLSAIFLFTTVILLLLQPFLKADNLMYLPGPIMLTITPYFLGMSAYEWNIRRWLKRQLERHQDLPAIFKFANASFEITSISFILFIVSRHLYDPSGGPKIQAAALVVFCFYVRTGYLRNGLWHCHVHEQTIDCLILHAYRLAKYKSALTTSQSVN